MINNHLPRIVLLCIFISACSSGSSTDSSLIVMDDVAENTSDAGSSNDSEGFEGESNPLPNPSNLDQEDSPPGEVSDQSMDDEVPSDLVEGAGDVENSMETPDSSGQQQATGNEQNSTEGSDEVGDLQANPVSNPQNIIDKLESNLGARRASLSGEPFAGLNVRYGLHATDERLIANRPRELIVKLEHPLETALARVSSNDRFNVEDGAATHFYSRRQAWNVDESLLIVGNKILDATTFSIINNEIPVSSAWNWSSVYNNVLYGIQTKEDRLNDFVAVNIDTLQTISLKHFNEYKSCRIGAGEGAISNNDHLVAISCINADGKKFLVSYDLHANAVLGRLKLEDNFNWASFTPSGEFIVLENSSFDTIDWEILRYNPDLSNSSFLDEQPNHGDICTDVNGDELFVMINYTRIYAVRLRDGKLITSNHGNYAVTPGYGHVSCRNIQRKGWAYFSADEGSWVGAISLQYQEKSDDESAPLVFTEEFELWSFHRSSSDSYESIAKMSVSPSGRQLIYTTDWYDSSDIFDVVVTPTSDSATWLECLQDSSSSACENGKYK